jgi:glutaredoxin
MQRALEALAQRHGFELELVDIEGRPELEARFGERVPVVFHAGEEICHYVLDEDELHAALARARNAGR